MIHQPHHRTSTFKQFLALPLLGVLVVLLSASQSMTEGPALAGTNAVQGKSSPALMSDTPQFPEGEKAMYRFLSNKVRIPSAISKNNLSGGVIVQVTIEKDGSHGKYNVLHAAHPEMEQEILRVVKLMPAWEPASAGGSAVTYVLPFYIFIDSGKIEKKETDAAFKQSLASAASTGSAEQVKVANEIVLVGYGPVAKN